MSKTPFDISTASHMLIERAGGIPEGFILEDISYGGIEGLRAHGVPGYWLFAGRDQVWIAGVDVNDDTVQGGFLYCEDAVDFAMEHLGLVEVSR